MAERGALLDMALDDIVKSRVDNERSRGRGRGRGGARGGQRRGGSSGGAIRRESRITSSNSGFRPYQKRTERVGGGNSGGFWEHDLYDETQEEDEFVEEEDTAPRRISATLRNRIGAGAAAGGAAKVVVSNLEHSVSQEDLEELFGAVGELQKVVLKYDRSGRSNGIADVYFARRADALKAVRDYNNVAIDGKPMVLALAASTTAATPAAPAASSSFRRETAQPSIRVSLSGRPTQSRGGRGFSRGGRGSRGGFRGGRGGRSQGGGSLSNDSLDAELDAYMEEAS